jgi:hypothetical protein
MLHVQRVLSRLRHRFGRFAIGDVIPFDDGSLATVVRVKPLVLRVNRLRQAPLGQEPHFEPPRQERERRAS